MDMFQPHGTEMKDHRTLFERMAHYRVPGVSLAVVCDYDLEWAKAYGIHQVGSDRTVTTETFFQAASTSKDAIQFTAIYSMANLS
jgi:CubicO group peptidase (beta-lactamase class C family)